MKTQSAFGRRRLPQLLASSKPQDRDLTGLSQGARLPDKESSAVDEEFRQWKAARGIRIPWRPLLLIASLSFGMAAFVLPASTSDPVQWTLGVLSGATFLAGLKRRAARRATA